MFYKVRTAEGQCMVVDERELSEWDENDVDYLLVDETQYLEEVVDSFLDDDMTDGETLDQVISLVDKGKCWA